MQFTDIEFANTWKTNIYSVVIYVNQSSMQIVEERDKVMPMEYASKMKLVWIKRMNGVKLK